MLGERMRRKSKDKDVMRKILKEREVERESNWNIKIESHPFHWLAHTHTPHICPLPTYQIRYSEQFQKQLMALKRTHEQVQYVQIPDLFRTSCIRNKSRFNFHEIFLFPFFVSSISPSRTFLILSSITAFLISLLLSSSSFLFYLAYVVPS